jgi:hypothetical protein
MAIETTKSEIVSPVDIKKLNENGFSGELFKKRCRTSANFRRRTVISESVYSTI